MPPSGEGLKGILVCGEAPGADEDRLGKQWQGPAGRLLRKTLAEFGVSLFGDTWVTNAVNCRPPGNRKPSPHELECCQQVILESAVEQLQPTLVLLLGQSAVSSFIGPSWRRGDLGQISRWRGWVIPDRRMNAWLCPTYHPSFILREQDSEEVQTIWRQDLKRALSHVGSSLPDFSDEEDQVTILTSESDVETILRKVRHGEEGKWIAFDYETTGLKPQGIGHKVVCVSLATAEGAYAFMTPENPRVLEQWRRVLASVRLGKAAHNMGFEDTWSNVIFKTPVRRWCWDSMLATHTLDNRPKINSLKFQTYVHFGVAGYGDVVQPFLEAKGGGNAKNQVEEFVRQGRGDELLDYCGLDSLYERRLAALQMDKIGIRTWL